MSKRPTQSKDNVQVIRRVLDKAAPRPPASAKSTVKISYAVRFAEEMAVCLAEDLQPLMRGITASAKRSASSVRGAKQLDVNFSTPATGLALGISLKSVHIREDTGARRYTHNKKRNEEELRIEASGYHKRQPYAVMIGVLFLPFDGCTDGKTGASSFGSWVRHLRPYAGRISPKDDEDRFEKIYIGLYEPDGTDLRFFDVESDPPRNDVPRRGGELFGRTAVPLRLLSYQEFLTVVHHAYLRRNAAEFKWADGTEDPLRADEIRDPADEE